jgi:hypothetical protein
MNAQSSCQLPYSLDGIQLWTIGREKIENNITLVLFDPGFKQFGMVISTVIENDMNYPLAACSLDDILQKFEICQGIECLIRQGQ